jgi:SPP1 family predicted phage head-tail adaptor
MSAGKLDRRIVIERATSTPNAFNEPVLVWAPLLTVWAERKDVSDAEKMSAGQISSMLMSRFVIRSSAAAKGVKPADRVNYDGRVWNIYGAKETSDGRNRFIEITAGTSLDTDRVVPAANQPTMMTKADGTVFVTSDGLVLVREAA